MLNWKNLWKRSRRKTDIYSWNLTSEAFYKTLKQFIRKNDNVLEFGSSTGHISYRLAKEGYNITLLDIRCDIIEIARTNFSRTGVKGNFICSDIFEFHNNLDFIWNSGLLQCFNDVDKFKLVKHLSNISKRILIFYPDLENPNKKIGMNLNAVPGVGDAKEYSIKKIPEIFTEFFDKIYFGKLEEDEVALEYGMYWIFAMRE